MIYFFQNSISLLHEFIFDAVSVKSVVKETFINFLLSNLFQVENISFINQFYKQSQLKKESL
jgi:hypothetical protein